MGISITLGVLIRYSSVVLSNAFYLDGTIALISGIAYYIQVKRLDNAVFEQKEALIHSLTLCPMIRPNLNGVMLVKRF